MKFVIKPIVCDYAVINVDTSEVVCICNIKRNAELIADILNGDTDNSCAYAYDVYPNAKYKIVKAESDDNHPVITREEREDTIYFLKGYLDEEVYTEKCRNAHEMAIKSLEQEPKTGHWEWVQYDYNPKLGNWHCSECRCVVVECVNKNEKGGIPIYKYCPQCGAKMESEEERKPKVYQCGCGTIVMNKTAREVEAESEEK